MMLLPFAWMIVTSLKAPSEINEWPPTWSTKKILKKRMDVKFTSCPFVV